MANLTISVDEEVLRRARSKALERGTSLNSVVNEYLTQYAGPNPAAAALSRFLELAAAVEAGSAPEGRAWKRDELYD